VNLNESNNVDTKEAWTPPELVEGCVKENTNNTTLGVTPDGGTTNS
jgi:hypothetical protein